MDNSLNMNDTSVQSNQPLAGVTPPASEPVDTTARPAFMTLEETTPLPNTNLVGNSIVNPPTDATEAPAVVTTVSGGGSGGSSSKKMIAAILGVVVLVAGVGAGVFALRSQQLEPASAWDCQKYNFTVTREGQVSITNGSTRNEPIQKARVSIDGQLVATLDVPALSPGQTAPLGTVTTPASGTFAWEVIGTIDCQDGGSYQAQASPTPGINALCSSVVAYDTSWDVLSSSDLSNLKPGNKVRFTVSGSATSGTLDKARFTVNGVLRAEVTTKRPGTNEFYDEYTIPAGTTTFNVSAQIHHLETNTWN